MLDLSSRYGIPDVKVFKSSKAIKVGLLHCICWTICIGYPVQGAWCQLSKCGKSGPSKKYSCKSKSRCDKSGPSNEVVVKVSLSVEKVVHQRNKV